MARLPCRAVVEVAGFSELEEIGRGASATVYRARQLSVNRTVALKVLQATLDADGLRRFKRECETVAALGWHPRVVGIFDAGTTDSGHPYLALEYLPDGSLGSRLSASGPLSPRNVTAFGIQIADALDAAHRQGIVHRDVKPGNVLVTQVGDVKLADFGIAALDGSNTSATGSMSGTLAYMAPELFEGKRATPSTDLYALGASMFTLLTGRVPFEAATPMAILGQVAHQPVPDLRNSGAPDTLASAIEWAMAKAPGDRPANATELIAALQAVVSAEGWPTEATYTDRHSAGPVGLPAAPTTVAPAPDNDLTTLARERTRPTPLDSPRQVDDLALSDLAAPPNTSGSSGPGSPDLLDDPTVVRSPRAATEDSGNHPDPVALRSTASHSAGSAPPTTAHPTGRPPRDPVPPTHRRGRQDPLGTNDLAVEATGGIKLTNSRRRRVVVPVLATILALALAFMGIYWSASRQYVVKLSGQNLAIYRGNPSGIGRVASRRVATTAISRDDLRSDAVPALVKGKDFPSRAAAECYVSKLILRDAVRFRSHAAEQRAYLESDQLSRRCPSNGGKTKESGQAARTTTTLSWTSNPSPPWVSGITVSPSGINGEILAEFEASTEGPNSDLCEPIGIDESVWTPPPHFIYRGFNHLSESFAANREGSLRNAMEYADDPSVWNDGSVSGLGEFGEQEMVFVSRPTTKNTLRCNYLYGPIRDSDSASQIVASLRYIATPQPAPTDVPTTVP